MGIKVQEKKKEEARGLLERRPGKASLTRRGHLSQDPKEAKEGAMWGSEGGGVSRRGNSQCEGPCTCVRVRLEPDCAWAAVPNLQPHTQAQVW